MKLLFVFKTFILHIIEWTLKTCFTVHHKKESEEQLQLEMVNYFKIKIILFIVNSR